MAHDFKNLMTAVLASVGTARKVAPGEPDLHRALDGIEEAAGQATRVTAGLLAFSRVEATRLSPVDLGDLVADSSRLLRRSLPAAIELVAELPPAGALWVNGNRTQLQQVLMNLAINARDAMPKGGKL